MESQKILPLLDNGHGIGTPGKRSPIWSDGSQLLEWEFNRDVVRRLGRMLESEGIHYIEICPTIDDVPLAERCARANAINAQNGGKCVLFSVHANAGGGTGFEAYTSVGTTRADGIATILYEEAQREFPDWKMRTDYSDGDPDKESQFYILVHTTMPAVLAEFFFMDTERDCRLLMSDDGRTRCAKVLFHTIKRLLQ